MVVCLRGRTCFILLASPTLRSFIGHSLRLDTFKMPRLPLEVLHIIAQEAIALDLEHQEEDATEFACFLLLRNSLVLIADVQLESVSTSASRLKAL
jgi:hypothetical protein